jgi:RNA polymerase sigma-70 factor (ECF subfamily)
MVSTTILDSAVAASAESDDAARARVTRMVEEHYDAVWRALRRLGVEESSADDSAQQTFLVAARRVHEIREGEERRYLLGISVRVAADVRRANRRRNAVIESTDLPDTPDPRPSADQLLDEKRAREQVDRILDQMEETSRVAFVLFELEGLTAPEIAETLGIPLGTVASRLRRAREVFRAQVQRLAGKGAP